MEKLPFLESAEPRARAAIGADIAGASYQLRAATLFGRARAQPEGFSTASLLSVPASAGGCTRPSAPSNQMAKANHVPHFCACRRATANSFDSISYGPSINSFGKFNNRMALARDLVFSRR
jgi:hypothetical protein